MTAMLAAIVSQSFMSGLIFTVMSHSTWAAPSMYFLYWHFVFAFTEHGYDYDDGRGESCRANIHSAGWSQTAAVWLGVLVGIAFVLTFKTPRFINIDLLFGGNVLTQNRIVGFAWTFILGLAGLFSVLGRECYHDRLFARLEGDDTRSDDNQAFMYVFFIAGGLFAALWFVPFLYFACRYDRCLCRMCAREKTDDTGDNWFEQSYKLPNLSDPSQADLMRGYTNQKYLALVFFLLGGPQGFFNDAMGPDANDWVNFAVAMGIFLVTLIAWYFLAVYDFSRVANGKETSWWDGHFFVSLLVLFFIVFTTSLTAPLVLAKSKQPADSLAWVAGIAFGWIVGHAGVYTILSLCSCKSWTERDQGTAQRPTHAPQPLNSELQKLLKRT